VSEESVKFPATFTRIRSPEQFVAKLHEVFQIIAPPNDFSWLPIEARDTFLKYETFAKQYGPPDSEKELNPANILKICGLLARLDRSFAARVKSLLSHQDTQQLLNSH
jgi:hypothetical protein